MEKSAVEQKGRWRHRFLIAAFAAVFSPLAAAPLPPEAIRALKLLPPEETVFVGQPCTYTLTLDGIDPSLVRAELPDFPADVRFISSKKETVPSAGGDAGTRLQFQFVFSAAGTPRLPPLPVYVSRRAYAILFAPVTVYEDPATLLPRLSVEFETARSRVVPRNGAVSVSVGETVRCTLSAQYCPQLLHFSWDVPKNAIFTETERFPLARGEPLPKTFSPDVIPVARFDWTPLVAGTYAVPPFAIEAVAYNGSRVNLALPAYRLIVRPSAAAPQKTTRSDPQDGVFARAFQPVPADGTDNDEPDDGAHGKVVPSVPGKTCARILLAAAIACAVFAVALVLCRRRWAFVPFVLALVFLLAFGWARAKGAHGYAVFRGGVVSLVPDDAATAGATLPVGTRVRVRERAGGWAYIDCDEAAGWVRVESLEEQD